MLCGTLILTFPKMLELTLGHAENTERPIVAYSLLAGVTVLFCGLIALYMWLAQKAKPSVLTQALRKFVKNLNDEKGGATGEIKSNENQVTPPTKRPAE